MVIHRRAVLAASVCGLIALISILLLRDLFTRSSTGADVSLGVATLPSRGVEGGTPLATRERIVPMRERTVSMRERADAVARAQVWRTPKTAISHAVLGADRRAPSMIDCRFRLNDNGGTPPTFDCLLPSGQELRVKYGPGAEVPAEAAATRLISALGFGADMVTLVERLRCYGCPNELFATGKLVEATRTQPLYERVSNEDSYEDFDWVAIEQKFAAAPIESDTQKGWAFFELDSVDPSKGGAPRAHVDALRLLAVFLAHWDNKSENQRLVCLSETWPQGTSCPAPFLLLQDVGSTFGPNRVDLEAWKAAKIWEDRSACKVSMADLPHGGGTFGPTRVSERGRRFLARQLEQITDAQLTDLFADARFDKPRSLLDQTSSVPDWVRAFKVRARTISEGPPCPDA